MSKCLIIYFSLGGTTARVAEAIASGLRRADYQVDFCNLKDQLPPNLAGYHLLGIGSPAYYFRPPFNVMDYLKDLPALNGVPFFSFVLHGTYLGDTGNLIRRALVQKGGVERGYFHCFGADFYLGYLKEGVLFSPDHPTAEELSQAEEFGAEVAARTRDQESSRQGEDPTLGIIYRVERFLLNRWLVKHIYSRLFQVNGNVCTNCGFCVEQCPTGNITEDEEGYPTWGRDCLLCLNCEMQCPVAAIASPLSLLPFRLAMRHNVSQASQDPSLDQVRVKYSQNRIERL